MTKIESIEYPVDLASAMTCMISEQIEDGTLDVKSIVVLQNEEENLYTLQITYKRTRGLSC